MRRALSLIALQLHVRSTGGPMPITGDYWAAGPAALRVGARWIVYFDRYRDHRYGALSSSDLKTWTDVTDQLSMPNGIRHGTAFAVPMADATRLLGRAP